jgi:translocator protein
MGKKIDFKLLIISLALPLLAGFVGSYFTTPNIPTWYAGLTKPSFNPPSWIFAPVWTALYLLMGYALYLITQTKIKKDKSKAYYLFGFQLILNSLWSIIFFGRQNISLAFTTIILLWLIIAITIIEFNKINKKAAKLLIPYILWVSFATLLNFAILRLN